MKLVANRINQVHLRDLLPVISEEIEVDFVLAAIAYGSSASDETKDLIGHAVANDLRLDLWMRYDHTVPVAVPLLRRLQRHIKQNVFTHFVRDCFHSKVIWWKGYGAYIGSANHTDRGWLTNIEAGVFIEESELITSGMDSQLDDFFEYLKKLDNTIPLSESYIKEMEMLSELNKDEYKKSKEARQHVEWEGPAFDSKQKAFDRRKENFKSEWLKTLGYLEDLQSRIVNYRPSWVGEDVPAAWQVDQFLHAYYYNRVGDGLRKPFEDFYVKNKSNPQAAVDTQLNWWKERPSAPSKEDNTFYVEAPRIRELLHKDKVKNLTVDELEILFTLTHATKDHVIKIPLTELGRSDLKTLSRSSRLKLFAPLMFSKRNRKGWGIRELLYYVLYDGPDANIWERLYHAGRDEEYTLSRYGLNSLAEVVGWARPDVVPPRNGRTSKALRALGYDVKIY